MSFVGNFGKKRHLFYFDIFKSTPIRFRNFESSKMNLCLIIPITLKPMRLLIHINCLFYCSGKTPSVVIASTLFNSCRQYDYYGSVV